MAKTAKTHDGSDIAKTPGPDLRRLNEVQEATGQKRNDQSQGKPDANINTPRDGRKIVER